MYVHLLLSVIFVATNSLYACCYHCSFGTQQPKEPYKTVTANEQECETKVKSEGSACTTDLEYRKPDGETIKEDRKLKMKLDCDREKIIDESTWKYDCCYKCTSGFINRKTHWSKVEKKLKDVDACKAFIKNEKKAKGCVQCECDKCKQRKRK